MLMQDFVTRLTYENLSEDVIQVLRRSLLDSIGVAAIGSQSEMAQIGTKTAKIMFGATDKSSARCLFDGSIASVAGAAMAGGGDWDLSDSELSCKVERTSPPTNSQQNRMIEFSAASCG